MKPKYSLDAVNLDGISDSHMEVLRKLNVALTGDSIPPESIMYYGRICECDDGYLCEHRLQAIVDHLKQTRRRLLVYKRTGPTS